MATVKPTGTKKTQEHIKKGNSGQQGAGQVRLNANIPEKLHERLAIAAVKNKRSQGSIIIELLEEHIKDYE